MIILGHHGSAPSGLLLDALKDRGLTWSTARPDRAERLPQPSAVAAAVVLGSREHSDEKAPEWAAVETDWLRSAHETGTAILGLGFGAQTLATALGGSVKPAQKPARGWTEISTAAPELIAPGSWFTWADSEIENPPGAELLAHNDLGPQAFRAGDTIGVHFHPHLTPQIITEWVYADAANGLDTQGILEATAREFKAAAVAAHRLLLTFASSAQRARR